MANPWSNPLKLRAIGAIGRGAGAAEGLAGAGAAMRVAGAPAGGVGGAGAREAAAAGAAAADVELAPADAGTPGASVGSLIVGAEVGLGGRLMRTVSFLGWTFAASAGLGGSAPPGDVGIFSAISFSSLPPT